MKYAWIQKHRDLFPVAVMCAVLEVSKSGYYEALRRPKSARTLRRERIEAAVRQSFEASHDNYGSVKITRELQKHEHLESACRNTVAAAMRKLGLKSRIRKRFVPTTTQVDPSRQAAPNKLDRNFTASAPNRKWVTDITYLATAEGWVYLAVVLDLFSRKVVGWSIADSLATELVNRALRNAIESRRPDGKHLLLHSDRGCQYTSDDYQATLRALQIECSMSRRGCCYDNAAMERFFWSLKHEWANHLRYENIADAQLSVFKYVETFYNSRRLHQTLGYKTPNEFEADHAPATAA